MINDCTLVNFFQDIFKKWNDMEKANEDIETLSARLISLEEAAELIKIKKGTLQNWLSQGSKFKRVKIGGRTFIDRLELENLLQVALSGK